MTIPLLMKYILTSLIAVNLLLGVAYLLFSIDRSEQQLDIDSELININGDKALLDKLIVNILFQNGQDEKLRTIFFKGKKYKDHLPSDRREFTINYDNVLFSKFGVDSFERVVGYDADKRTLTFVSIKDAVYYCTNNEEMSIESCIQSNEKIRLNQISSLEKTINNYLTYQPIMDSEIATYRCRYSFPCSIHKLITSLY